MRCGVGDYTASLARALQDSDKAQIAVLTGEGAKIEVASGVEVIQVPDWRLRSVVHILRVIARWNPDLVHIQFPTQGYAGYWLPWTSPLVLRMSGFRVVQTWHEFFPMGGHRRSFIPCIACDTAIVVRPEFMKSISTWYRWLLRKSKIVFIPGASSVPHSRLSEAARAHLHEELVAGQERVVTYFGFAHPNKGVEQLFQIANPERDRLVLLCDLQDTNDYQKKILDECQRSPWINKVTVTGFLPSEKVADILAASDAVVLPFPGGGGDWNSSLTAVLAQGTLVVTTSISKDGYDPKSNVFFAKPGDINSMASALVAYGGRKISRSNNPDQDWARIAASHLDVYTEVLKKSRGSK